MLIRNYIQLNACSGVVVMPPDCSVAHISRRYGGGTDHIVGLHESSKLECSMNSPHTLFITKNTKLSEWNLQLVGAPRSMVCIACNGSTSTKPVAEFENKNFSRPRNAPSIETLRAAASSISLPVVQDRVENPVKPARAGALYRQLGHQHTYTDYPIGNTYGRDLLRGTKLKYSSPDREIRIIFCACGHIRNVVETIAARNANESSRVTFVLNDSSPEILARNIVLLEQKNGSTRKGAAETWLHAWGSIALSKSERSFLDTVIKNFPAGKLPAWLVGLPKEVRKSMTACWNSWAACSKSLSDIRNQRSHFCPNTKAVSQKAVKAAALTVTGNTPTELVYAELLKGKGNSVNPTLLSVPERDYNMTESPVFRALDLREYVNGDASKLLSGARSALAQKGKKVAASLHSNKARILILPGDLTEVFHSEADADVVDMSNAMDYISKPVCILVGSRCIRRPGGILLMHTMMVGDNDERTNVEVEMDSMLEAKGLHVADVLGLQKIYIEEDESTGDTSLG